MRPRIGLLTPALVALAALLAIPAVRHLTRDAPPPPHSFQLSFRAPTGVEAGSGDEALDAAIAPDERQLAYVATAAGVPRLWIHSLATDSARPLSGTEGARNPAWKDGGGVVAFFAGGMLKQVSLADGAIRSLADASDPAGATWLPDGSVLFAPTLRGQIWHLRNGLLTAATELRPGDRGHVFPMAGPHGSFAYTAARDDGKRVVRLVANGEHELGATSGHGQVVGNVLLHVRDEALLAQPIDQEAWRPVGRATPLRVGVAVSPGGRALFVASSRLLLSSGAAARNRALVWFNLAGQQLGAVGEAGDFWQVRLSPDDRFAALTYVDPQLRTLDVATLATTAPSAQPQQLSLAVAADTDPVWSEDGRRVVFRSMEAGRPRLMARDARDPAAQLEPFQSDQRDLTPSDWQRDALYVTSRDAQGTDVLALVSSPARERPIARSGFNQSDARVAPDGRRLAYVSDESGRPDIYVVDRRDGSRQRVSLSGGTKPRWSYDGATLFFLRGSHVMAATRADGAASRFATPREVFAPDDVRDFDTSKTGRRLIALVPAARGFLPEIHAAVDWQSRVARASNR